jgi:hypothetical protein
MKRLLSMCVAVLFVIGAVASVQRLTTWCRYRRNRRDHHPSAALVQDLNLSRT